MAGHTNRLLDIFEDLDNSEFGKFQWQLRMEGSVKKSILDDADRMKTIDAMVGTYDDQVLEVTRRILEKIKRIDLIKKIPGSGSGYNGAAATPQNSQDVDVDGAEEKLTSVRDEFVKRVSEPFLNSLVDKLHVQKFILDEEMEAVAEVNGRAGKARKFIDIVRAKGDESSSVMIGMVRKLDPTLSKLLRW